MNYDNLIPTDKMSSLNIDTQKFINDLPPVQFNIEQPTLPKFKNPMVEEQKKLNNMVEQLKQQINSIQYENMKLNAQIETLNKTIDSDNEKLDELRISNSNLKTVNQTLKDSNKHYWLYTALISIGCAILGVILGYYF